MIGRVIVYEASNKKEVSGVNWGRRELDFTGDG